MVDGFRCAKKVAVIFLVAVFLGACLHENDYQGGTGRVPLKMVDLDPGESYSSLLPEGEWSHHAIEVPAEQEILRVSGRVSSQGDEVEFVVAQGERPDNALLRSGTTPCSGLASRDGGEREFFCEIENPDEGRWYASVVGREGISRYTVRPLYGSNVARATNGGEAAATYDLHGASVVINGFTEGDFWAGMQTGDTLFVNFDREYRVFDVKVHGDIDSSWPFPVSLLEANDESLEEDIFYFLFNGNRLPPDVGCVRVRVSDAGLFCSKDEDARAVRRLAVQLESGNSNQAGADVVIHEIEAIGIPVEE